MEEKKDIYYVYVTTNLINGKQYIGDHMLKQHRNDYYIGSGHLIKKAIKKYGDINFFKEILEWYDNRSDAFYAQEKYIKEFNTLQPSGYNLSPVGGTGVPNWCSEETRKKIGDASRGRKQSLETIEKRVKTTRNGYWSIKRYASEETKKKLSDSHKGPRPWRVGKKLPPHTEEYKIARRNFRHSDDAKRKIGIAFSKPVLQFDLDGNFIKEYPSAISASIEIGISQRCICAAANPTDRQKTAKGFIWKYKNKNNE